MDYGTVDIDSDIDIRQETDDGFTVKYTYEESYTSINSSTNSLTNVPT